LLILQYLWPNQFKIMRLVFLSLGLFIALIACKTKQISKPTIESDRVMVEVPKLQYPQTRRDNAVVDNYHGKQVADPYRWLEDDNAAETKAWVDAENVVTNGYLAAIPYRKQIVDRMTTMWNYERYGAPFREGNRYFYFKNNGLQNQSVLYAQNSLTSEGTVLLDPNTFSEKGTSALGGMSFDKMGRFLAYQVSEAGSDWNKILVMDSKSGSMLEDTISWVKFSGISWYKDGFYYSRYPEPKAGDELKGKSLKHSVYYHKIGTNQSADQLIASDSANPNYNFYGGTTEDERFLIVGTSESTSGNRLAVRDMSDSRGTLIPIVTDFEHDFDVIDNDGGELIVMTNHGAAKLRILRIDPTKPAMDQWQTLVAEHKTDVLQGAAVIGGKLLLTYLHNAHSVVRIHNMATGAFEKELELPGIGTVSGLSGKKEDVEAFYSFTSYTYPTTIFRLDVATGKSSIFRTPAVKGFDPTQYETKQLWYASKDGTQVPMFVTHKKGIVLNGKNPTWLYGYGGFNISLTPSFSVSKLAFLEQGGVFVVANIRGGGEFGSEWHDNGTKEKKQNVFDDFIGAAEYLIAQKYTSPAFLAIEGGSNGGLLVGACMTQRPELFRVCFPRVGVLDMLRYHQFTIGRAWSIDYGLSEEAAGFDYLYKYSPLHNVKPASYPNTMVMTADHDDRVVPAHSFKFAAELQYKHTGKNPVLIRIEKSAGHGAGKPTSKVIEESADMMAFLLFSMGLEYK
jgi:prolyl oligopeptidase